MIWSSARPGSNGRKAWSDIRKLPLHSRIRCPKTNPRIRGCCRRGSVSQALSWSRLHELRTHRRDHPPRRVRERRRISPGSGAYCPTPTCGSVWPHKQPIVLLPPGLVWWRHTKDRSSPRTARPRTICNADSSWTCFTCSDSSCPLSESDKQAAQPSASSGWPASDFTRTETTPLGAGPKPISIIGPFRRQI